MGPPKLNTAGEAEAGSAGELITEVRIDRRSLVNRLFYGVYGVYGVYCVYCVENMRIGGTRRLAIAPHTAHGDKGVPGVVPAAATLAAEISILEARGP